MLKIIKDGASRVGYKIRDFMIPWRALISAFPFSTRFPGRGQGPRVFRTLAVRNPCLVLRVGPGPGSKTGLSDTHPLHLLPVRLRVLSWTHSVPHLHPKRCKPDRSTSGSFMSEKEANSRAVGFPSGHHWDRCKHVFAWLTAFFWFSQMPFPNLCCVNPDAAGNMWPSAHLLRTAAPFEELFLKIRTGETPRGLCSEAHAT